MDKTIVAFEQTDKNIQLLKDTLSAANTNLSDPELRLFLYQAKQTGLDPLAKQIYVMKMGGKLTIMVSIDGLRLVAQRTNQYRGQVGPQWCGKDGEWKDVWLQDEHPAAARVGVYRENFKAPVYGVATWKSYGKTTGVWNTMPDVMLAKCAESLAIRKSFPQELSGIYTQEELDKVTPDKEQPVTKITDLQKLELSTIMNDKGIAKARQKAVLLKFASAALEQDIKSAGDMTEPQAAHIITELKNADGETLEAFYGGGE